MTKIKKVVLIEPQQKGVHFFKLVEKIPRLGVHLLGTILQRQGSQVKSYVEVLSPINWQAIEEADLVGISCLTPTAPRAYELAREVKQRKPGVPIVIGGPHVTFLPEETLQEGADFVVRGEGEDTILELIKFLNEAHFPKELPEEIPGLSFKKEGQFIHTPNRPFITDLDRLPFPDFRLTEGLEKMSDISIQTSRGCPHNCKFCSVIKMFGRGYRFRSVDSVIAELEILKRNYLRPGIHLFVCDDNFADNPERTVELLEAMLKNGFKHQWSTQARVKVAEHPDILKLMRQTGCKRLYLGLESINPETLKAYRKGQTVEDIIRAIEMIHRYGILVHGMFVVGSDQDTLSTIKEIGEFIIKHRIDSAQILVLTPAPGTETYQELDDEGRIFLKGVSAWIYYDGHHVVHQPNLIDPWQLQNKVIKTMEELCSYWRLIRLSLPVLTSALTLRFRSLRRKADRAAFPWFGHRFIKQWRWENQGFLQWLEKRSASTKQRVKA